MPYKFGLIRLVHVLEDAHMLPTICQVNMELHGPPDRYNSSATAFAAILYRLLKRGGRYMLINADRLDKYGFHRLYFLNVKDTACIEKFICRT